MASVFGEQLKIKVWGASHAPEIGITIEGLPKGILLDMDEIQKFLNRRKGGQNAYSTKRQEADTPVIQSGAEEYRTTGEPLTAIFLNQNTRSSDYDEMRYIPRPSHADYTSYVKYGDSMDRSGGGMFSGRLTLPLCFAGAVCMQILKNKGVRIAGHVSAVGGICDDAFDSLNPDIEGVGRNGDHFPVLNPEAGEQMVALMTSCAAEGDSVGGVIECAVTGLPAGVGEPLYESVEAHISELMFGVPAVKGIEFGSGFKCAEMKGSECNDPFIIEDGTVKTKTNHSGGIQGGITNGMPVILRVAVKPTPSIYKEQQTVNMKELTETTLSLKGRHDPCIVPRALPCIEAVCAIALYDLMIAGGFVKEESNPGEPAKEEKEAGELIITDQKDGKSAKEVKPGDVVKEDKASADTGLSSVREQIDALDDRIASLISDRMDLAGAIALKKKEQGLSVRNEKRENEVLNHVAAVSGEEKGEYMKEIYRAMMNVICEFEENKIKN